MKDPKEEQWYFINITDIGPSSVSYFDVHDFDIYSIFVCVLYDSEINTNKQTSGLGLVSVSDSHVSVSSRSRNACVSVSSRSRIAMSRSRPRRIYTGLYTRPPSVSLIKC